MPTKYEKLLLTLLVLFVFVTWTVTMRYPATSIDISSFTRRNFVADEKEQLKQKEVRESIEDRKASGITSGTVAGTTNPTQDDQRQKVHINNETYSLMVPQTNEAQVENHPNTQEKDERLEKQIKPTKERRKNKHTKLNIKRKKKITNFIPPIGAGILRKPLDRRCCMIWFSENPGHALTEIPFQLARCGPVVSIDYFPFPHIDQIEPLIDLFQKTNTTTQECFDYYNYYPEEHPTTDFAFAFASMAIAYNLTYNAYEVGRNLRDAQNRILSSCGLSSPMYDHVIPDDIENIEDGRKYELVSNRIPSTSIIILVRSGRRVLRNAEQILPICQQLNVSCKIIQMEEFWNQPETKDLCYILRTFENALIISMQGAELIYPLYLGSRQLLITFKEKKVSASDTRHYGKANSQNGEVEVLPNFVDVKNPYNGGLDSFFPDFALHLGSEITIVHGKMLNPHDDENPHKALEIKSSSQCIPRRKNYKAFVNGIKNYCLDMEVDLNEVESLLKQRIFDGSLLQLPKQ